MYAHKTSLIPNASFNEQHSNMSACYEHPVNCVGQQSDDCNIFTV